MKHATADEVPPRLIPIASTARSANNLGVIRIALALLVVWSHSFALYLGTEVGEPVSRLLNGRANAGEIAVRLFFVISGYLIIRSALTSSSTASFLNKRVRRVYPGFLASTAICTLIVVPLFAAAGFSLVDRNAVLDWAWRALLLQEVIPGADAFAGNPSQTVNGALWSIRYEFWFYLCVAALAAARLLPRPSLTLFLLVGSLAFKAALDLADRKPGGGALTLLIGWPYVWFTMGPYFLAGMAAHFYGSAIPRSRVLLLLLVAALIGAAHLEGRAQVVFDMLCPLVLAYGLFGAAYARRASMSTDRLGDISYGVYLYGFPIQQMILATIILPFPVYVAACLAASMLAGWLSWHFVERPFLHRRGPIAAPPAASAASVIGLQPAGN